jgi:hypothetical protein
VQHLPGRVQQQDDDLAEAELLAAGRVEGAQHLGQVQVHMHLGREGEQAGEVLFVLGCRHATSFLREQIPYPGQEFRRFHRQRQHIRRAE